MTTTRSGFTKLAAICIAILLGAVIWELGWPLTHAEHEWSRLIAAVATLGHLTGVLGSFFRKEINRPSPEAADFPDYLLPADLPADRQGAAGGQLHEVYGSFHA